MTQKHLLQALWNVLTQSDNQFIEEDLEHKRRETANILEQLYGKKFCSKHANDIHALTPGIHSAVKPVMVLLIVN